MKSNKLSTWTLGLALSVLGASFSVALRAQVPWAGVPPAMAVPTTPTAQRSGLNNVRAQVGWLQNATRTASRYPSGADMLWQQFQALRNAYVTFSLSLNSSQVNSGANELAELSAGLDILQQSFSNYQDDVANGRSPTAALAELCQVLQEASRVWLQEFNQDSARLRIGY